MWPVSFHTCLALGFPSLFRTGQPACLELPSKTEQMREKPCVFMTSAQRTHTATSALFSLLETIRYVHPHSVHSLSRVQFFVTPWTTACQASLSITNSQSLLKLMSTELVMPSNHLTLCHPLLFLPSIFPSAKVFSSESVLHIRWPKYWSFSFSLSPSNEYSGLISFRMDWLDLLAVHTQWEDNCILPSEGILGQI